MRRMTGWLTGALVLALVCPARAGVHRCLCPRAGFCFAVGKDGLYFIHV